MYTQMAASRNASRQNQREKNTGSAEQNEGQCPERDFSNGCEREREQTMFSGDDSKEDPPVPIPNTVVKLFRVDDTWRATAWESRTLPERGSCA